MAYANSGDVLKVQALLSLAGEHIEVEESTLWKVRCHDMATALTLSRSCLHQTISMSSGASLGVCSYCFTRVIEIEAMLGRPARNLSLTIHPPLI